MLTIWHDFLYQPVFNFLIWVYNNWTDQNLGWAVVYMTIILRLILLPFSIISEKNKNKNLEIREKAAQISKAFPNDPIMRKEEIRKVLKTRKVNPWSKAIVLGAQGLVLVLLYQVFLRGITGDKVIKILYPFIDYPGKINTTFYGFELGQTHNSLWALIVALLLFFEIYRNYRKHKVLLQKGDLAYFFLFPLFTFLLLWMLPMVKSLFILTSMIFSIIITQISKIFFKTNKI
jgi:membrane protein insertase Oxa1/YidC/SpoIIIJ